MDNQSRSTRWLTCAVEFLEKTAVMERCYSAPQAKAHPSLKLNGWYLAALPDWRRQPDFARWRVGSPACKKLLSQPGQHLKPGMDGGCTAAIISGKSQR
jgi:hypothetical protein